jgi:hypothetical protein
MANGKPELVVAGLDFFDFVVNERPNARRPAQPPEPSDFERRLLVNADGSRNRFYALQRIKDHATVLFSINTVADSLQTVAMQNLADQPDLTELGFNPMHEYRRFVRVDGHHVLFRQVDATYLTSYLQTRAAIYEAGTDSSPALDRLRELTALCRASGIRLVLYVHPYHAHMLESYRIAGLWPLFEEWKRAVAGIVDEESRSHPGGPPVALWDFSGYSEISGEAVPAASERGRPMRWYWEAGHYKREVGELMLARILGQPAQERHVPPGFGVRLDKENVERHLAAIRAAREIYAQARGAEIEALQKAAESIQARPARASHRPQ